MKRSLLRLLSLCGLSLLNGCGGAPSAFQQSFPPLTITTASLPNGTSQLPYSQTIQASGGVAPFTWTVSAGTLPHNLALSISATGTAIISGLPDTAAQGVAFTIKVTDSANQSATQSYTVSILLEPDTLTVAPLSLSFALQLVGTASGAQAATLTNTGSSALVITGVAMTGTNAADFSESSTCGSTLASGANCAIHVTFTPSQLGPRCASIMITDNSVGSPHSLSLNGGGLNSGPDATLSATSLIFANQVIGTASPAQSITLSNYGTGTLSIATIAASASFGETNTCGSTLAPGGNCTISVTFTPGASGSLNGTVSVTDLASDSPQIVSLSGTGIGGMCRGQGAQCAPQLPPCCSGLVCQFAGLRAFCEPRTAGNTSRTSSYWDQMNANKLE